MSDGNGALLIFSPRTHISVPGAALTLECIFDGGRGAGSCVRAALTDVTTIR